MKIKGMSKFSCILAGTALALTLAGPAGADTVLTLSGPFAGNTIGPQSASAPCIIAGTNCSNPAGFGFNNFTSSGAISTYNMYSTTPTATVPDGVMGTPYTVSQITGQVGTSFMVAIDVNTTQEAGETLDLFEVLDMTTSTRLYHYTGPTAIGNILANGNGFGDWTLGTINLSGVASTDQILFHAQWHGASDGAESFFLVSAPVPEPQTYGMLAAGLGMLGFISRRRRRNES